MRFSATYAGPIDSVFSIMSDARNGKDLYPRTWRVVRETPEPVGGGTVFTVRRPSGPPELGVETVVARMEITRFERPTLIETSISPAVVFPRQVERLSGRDSSTVVATDYPWPWISGPLWLNVAVLPLAPVFLLIAWAAHRRTVAVAREFFPERRAEDIG